MNYTAKLREIIEAGGTRATTPRNTVLVTVTKQGEVVVGDSRHAAAQRWLNPEVVTERFGNPFPSSY